MVEYLGLIFSTPTKTTMQKDNLRFFVLAGHALFAVSIRQYGDRPVLRRIRHGSTRDEPEFINGIIMPGYYVSLTGLGLFKHPASDDPDGRLEGDRPPAPGCGLNCRYLGHDTVILRETAGFFLGYSDAYQAMETSISTPFAEIFRSHTRETLGLIGRDHPTVRLATQGKYSLPEEVLP